MREEVQENIGEQTTTLDRPVGQAELALIEPSGFRAFPPRHSPSHPGPRLDRMLAPLLREVVTQAQIRAISPGGLSGVPTGLPDVDALVHGLQPGSLTLLAGHPSMGKTALAITFALGAAGRGHPVLVFATEDSPFCLGRRFLAAHSGLALDELDRPQSPEALAAAVERLEALPIDVVDGPGRPSPTQAAGPGSRRVSETASSTQAPPNPKGPASPQALRASGGDEGDRTPDL